HQIRQRLAQLAARAVRDAQLDQPPAREQGHCPGLARELRDGEAALDVQDASFLASARAGGGPNPVGRLDREQRFVAMDPRERRQAVAQGALEPLGPHVHRDSRGLMVASRRTICCTMSDCISLKICSSSSCLDSSWISPTLISRRTTRPVWGSRLWPAGSSTRKDVRSRSSYSTGRPVVEKPIASFSRRSVRTTRIASAASRSSTIRVPLEERTTRRNSEPSAEVRENVVYRVLNGRPV